MSFSRIAIVLGCVLATSACATHSAATRPSQAGNAAIPFVNLGNVYDWASDGRRGIYIQTLDRSWYYAKTLAPCFNLPFALSVGFVVKPAGGSFDKFSSIVVQGEVCPIRSVRRSGPPPSDAKRWRRRHPHKPVRHQPQ